MWQNRQITDYPLQDKKVLQLENKLSLCGRFASKRFYCKKCEAEGNTHLLGATHSRFFCEIRYCSHPECILERFSRQVETFKDIKRMHELHKLWHFAIGFEPIPEIEFKKNFSKYKKRNESVLNKYFEKLRKNKIHLQGIRVLDFSFVKDGFVYLHYHFACIPVGSNKIRSTLILMQDIRKKTISKQKIKIPFHLQSFGLASKQAVFSYMAIRAVGLYKYESTIKTTYKVRNKKLVDSIEQNLYITLDKILTKEEYIKTFYNKSFFVTIGGLPRPLRHGSTITDTFPNECTIHGHLERKDVRIEVVFDEPVEYSVIPPPEIKKYPQLEIEYIRFH